MLNSYRDFSYPSNDRQPRMLRFIVFNFPTIVHHLITSLGIQLKHLRNHYYNYILPAKAAQATMMRRHFGTVARPALTTYPSCLKTLPISM